MLHVAMELTCRFIVLQPCLLFYSSKQYKLLVYPVIYLV
jgi:hypothetical protein